MVSGNASPSAGLHKDPLCLDLNASAAFSGCAPMMRALGHRAFTAVVTPLISPPPPIVTMTASRSAPPVRSLTWLTSSRPIVPILAYGDFHRERG